MAVSDINPSNRIKEDDYVILERVHEDKTRIARATKEGLFYWNALRINIGSLVGQQFEAVYEFDKTSRNLTPVKMSDTELFELIGTSSDITSLEEVDDTKDNRFLNDDGKSQKLSRDDIEVLKSEGMAGQQIIETLVENSSTFKAKSAFAQEKYLKKKKEKYSNYFRVMNPTSRLLTEMYHSQSPYKLYNMRVDSLSQMLTSCNVRSGGNYVVVDNNLGLIAAAVMERLVGDGRLPSGVKPGTCIQVYTELGPQSSWRNCVESINIDNNLLTGCLLSLQFKQLYNMLHEVNEDDYENAIKAHEGRNGDHDEDAKRRKLDERSKRRAERKLEEETAKEILKHKSIDGILVILRQVEPIALLNTLIEFLAPSAPFAVYCSTMEPLAELYSELRAKRCINVKLSESWLRKYQVLPGRTRPDMNMSGSGGYLLTGIKSL